MGKWDWWSLLWSKSGSVLMIVCGGILAAAPDSGSVLLSAVLGWVLIALGVMLLIGGFVGGTIGALVPGVVLLAAGAWLHRHPLMIASALGIVLGLVVLVQGWKRMKLCRRRRCYGSFWQWDALVAAVELLLGLVLLLSPLIVSRLLLAAAGIFLVLCGAAELASGWRSGDDSGGSGRIIDADR